MKRGSLWLILFLGLILRFLLAFSTFHPDIGTFHFAGKLVYEGNIFNLYDYISNLPKTHPLTKIYPPDVFIYPPFIYLFFGFFSTTFSNVVPNVIHQRMIYDPTSVLGDIRFNWLLSFFKLPYVFFDLSIAFLLAGLFSKDSNKLLAFSFWIFNPVNLYTTYMMGQFDIIPTFFVILSLYLLRRNNLQEKRFYFSALCLGLGASFKIYPLLFVAPLVFLIDNWKARISSLFISFGTYFLTLAPFLGSPVFRSSALIAGQTIKSFYAKIPISGGESIILYPAVLFVLYLFFYYSKDVLNNLWRRFFVILLIFFVFTHYHPQWFLWVTPFFVIDLVKSKLKNWPLVALSLISFFSLLFFFEPSLTLGLFSPVFPFLYNTRSVWEILRINPDINFSRSFLHTIFAASAVYYIFFIFLMAYKKRS